jgi:protein SCO1/2
MRRAMSPWMMIAGLGLSLAGACERNAASTTDAPPAAAPSLYSLGSTWTRQDDAHLQLSALKGQVRVAAMAYTRCSAACPALVQSLKRVEAELSPEERARVGFVLFSMDPEHDDPGAMHHYAEAHNLKGWTLLASDEPSTRELAVALDVAYARQPDGSYGHASKVFILDRDGAIAHREEAGDFAPAAVAQAIRDVLARDPHRGS